MRRLLRRLRGASAPRTRGVDLVFAPAATEVEEIRDHAAPDSADVLKGYTLINKLDEGGFGEVHLATHDATGEEVAIKFFKAEKDPEAGLNERLVLERLGMHANVVELLDVTLDSQHNEALVVEYLGGGTMSTLVRDHPGGWLTKDQADLERRSFRVWHGIVMGIAHMHRMGVCHNDLKPENVLLPTGFSFDGTQHVSLIDFSHAMVARAAATSTTPSDEKIKRVPPENLRASRYMAPEAHRAYGKGLSFDGFKADLWALGVMLYMLLELRYPFGDDAEFVIKDPWKRLERFSTEVSEVFDGLFAKAPNKRLTIEGIQASHWWAMQVATLPAALIAPPPHGQDARTRLRAASSSPRSKPMHMARKLSVPVSEDSLTERSIELVDAR